MNAKILLTFVPWYFLLVAGQEEFTPSPVTPLPIPYPEVINPSPSPSPIFNAFPQPNPEQVFTPTPPPGFGLTISYPSPSPSPMSNAIPQPNPEQVFTPTPPPGFGLTISYPSPSSSPMFNVIPQPNPEQVFTPTPPPGLGLLISNTSPYPPPLSNAIPQPIPEQVFTPTPPPGFGLLSDVITGVRSSPVASPVASTVAASPVASTVAVSPVASAVAASPVASAVAASPVATPVLALSCGSDCENDTQCTNAKGGCTYCRGRHCVNQWPMCAQFCNGDGDCFWGTDSCKKCFQHQCVQERSTCIATCTLDFDCWGSTDGCSICRNSKCVDKWPRCGQGCSSSTECYGATDGCSICKDRKCVQIDPQCNAQCGFDSDCSNAHDGCIYCNMQRKLCVSFLPHYGTACASNNDCAGARDGSTICDLQRHMCVSNLPYTPSCGISCYPQHPTPFCGMSCRIDPECTGATGGCNYCNTDLGICDQHPAPYCGMSCSSNECFGAKDGCAYCLMGKCGKAPLIPTTSCGSPCSNDAGCAGASNGCVHCNTDLGICDQHPAPYCGMSCTSNECYAAKDGCTDCIQGQCSKPGLKNPTLPQCGTKCTADFACLGAANDCGHCNKDLGICDQHPAPYCGMSCISNECYAAKDGCTDCIQFQCSKPGLKNPTLPQCGTKCHADFECAGASNGCTTCFGMQCTTGNKSAGACVSDENGLVEAFKSVGTATADFTVLICSKAVIKLTKQLDVGNTGKARVFLTCAEEKTCTIQGTGSFRLIKFNSGNVEVTGITFTGGNSGGEGGGAVFIGGEDKSSKFYHCTFNGNSAPTGKGGAIFCDSCEIKETYGSANSAAQCNDIYFDHPGSCGMWNTAVDSRRLQFRGPYHTW